MKPQLLYRDREFAWRPVREAARARMTPPSGRSRQPAPEAMRPLAGPWNSQALVEDLALDTLFAAMANGDAAIFETARAVVLNGETDEQTIRYRQAILRDCLDRPAVVRALYALAMAAEEAEKKHYLSALLRSPDWVLRWAIELTDALLGFVKELRTLAARDGEPFASPGWRRFFSAVQEEMSEAWAGHAEDHLEQLRFRNGVVLGARLGEGNKGVDYRLERRPAARPARLRQLLARWLPRWFKPPGSPFGFSIHPRDESGVRALSELQNRGLALAAEALADSADHMRDFFAALRVELAFYVGCINLAEDLGRRNVPICMPEPAGADDMRLSFKELRNVCLALTLEGPVIGNDLAADARGVVIVTGANQGGKSTFLRSIGLAQLMMQSGMFVAAERFRSSLCDALSTHFRREEDPGMESGKFDEELRRMSEIVDHLGRNSMILFNESFAATNEREGSEIARQITLALAERRVRIVFVTHLYEFARAVHDTGRADALFLRAERRPDGLRTFRLAPGGPALSSHGEDLYEASFGDPAEIRIAATTRQDEYTG